MATEHSGLLDQSIPQWKRELILRRRAVGRVLPAGSGSVQLTCPSVVAAVRHPEFSTNADFHLRRYASEREQTGDHKNMRLVEQVNTSGDFVEPGIVPDIKELMSRIENSSVKNFSKMGEEKIANKRTGSPASNATVKKSTGEFLEEENLSDSSEEFKYGPGIVSRLKSRYLSLTLRESQGKIRPSLANLRRASSLENLLDGPENDKPETVKTKYVKNTQSPVNGNATQRCRAISRGNKDSMKRARSVEALMRYEKVTVAAVEQQQNRRSLEVFTKVNEFETEDNRKIRKRYSSSSVEEKELPPPDVVKQTLKIFESSSNSKISIKPASPKVTATGENVSASASKPVISKKPVLSGQVKQNGANKPGKVAIEMESLKCKESDGTVKDKTIETSKRTYSLDTIHKDTHSPEKKILGNRSISADKLTMPEKLRVSAVLIDKTNESVILKKPSSEVHNNSNASVDYPDGEEKCKQLVCSPSKDGMTLELIETSDSKLPQYVNKQKSSPTSTSPKSFSDVKKTTESPEATRPISPVLVKAPPCILSTELSTNSSNVPMQHMKQVGVIRPIVTNKALHSNATFPSKYPNQFLHQVLTNREIEKNLINTVKSIEQPVTKVIVSLKKSPEECIVGNVNLESNKQNEESKKGIVWDKKPNTIVFNFSNRKSVPDYIENDGLINSSRKEKPKRGEPGIIFLGGTTDDSYTDGDVDDFVADPPSPCDIVFEGDNILINGRSNIQTKPKQRKLRIQFKDETQTFHYPSETSMLDEHETPESETSSASGNSPGLSNPLRCSSLASYTPSKLSMTEDFQLGVTRSTPPPAPPTANTNNSDNLSDTEEDYLRPADENNTIAWSSETAADLLF